VCTHYAPPPTFVDSPIFTNQKAVSNIIPAYRQKESVILFICVSIYFVATKKENRNKNIHELTKSQTLVCGLRKLLYLLRGPSGCEQDVRFFFCFFSPEFITLSVHTGKQYKN